MIQGTQISYLHTSKYSLVGYLYENLSCQLAIFTWVLIISGTLHLGPSLNVLMEYFSAICVLLGLKMQA